MGIVFSSWESQEGETERKLALTHQLYWRFITAFILPTSRLCARQKMKVMLWRPPWSRQSRRQSWPSLTRPSRGTNERLRPGRKKRRCPVQRWNWLCLTRRWEMIWALSDHHLMVYWCSLVFLLSLTLSLCASLCLLLFKFQYDWRDI